MPRNEAQKVVSFKAAADLSAAQYHAVRLTAADTVNVGTLAGKCVGILQGIPAAAGRGAEVCVSGVTIAMAGGTISANDNVESTATGTLQTQSGDGYRVGIALEAATAGSLFSMLVTCGQYDNVGIERLTDDGGITAGLIVTSGTADGDAKTAGAGDKPIGVCAVTSLNNDPAYIAVSGMVECTAGDTVTRGDSIVPDAAGKGRLAGYLGGKHAVGIAVDSAVADASFTMVVCPHTYYPETVVHEMTAGADLSADIGKCVKIGASDNECLLSSVAGAISLGVLLNAPNAVTAEIAVAGVVKVLSGALVALGNEVYVDATGRVQPAVASDGYYRLGIALEDTAGAGNLIYVLLHGYQDAGNVVVAPAAAGYLLKAAQHTTVNAVDTVASGMTTILSAIAVMDSDPITAEAEFATCEISGTDIKIKTWELNEAAPNTLVAATTFSKKVNYIIIGQ